MDYIAVKTGRRVASTTLSRNLRNLVKTGFLEKVGEEYKIVDPIVRYAVLEGF